MDLNTFKLSTQKTPTILEKKYNPPQQIDFNHPNHLFQDRVHKITKFKTLLSILYFFKAANKLKIKKIKQELSIPCLNIFIYLTKCEMSYLLHVCIPLYLQSFIRNKIYTT